MVHPAALAGCEPWAAHADIGAVGEGAGTAGGGIPGDVQPLTVPAG